MGNAHRTALERSVVITDAAARAEPALQVMPVILAAAPRPDAPRNAQESSAVLTDAAVRAEHVLREKHAAVRESAKQQELKPAYLTVQESSAVLTDATEPAEYAILRNCAIHQANAMIRTDASQTALESSAVMTDAEEPAANAIQDMSANPEAIA
jgi:hypothetical protein